MTSPAPGLAAGQDLEQHPTDAGASGTPPVSAPRRWAGFSLRLHHLLFIAFTMIAGVPIAVLALWESSTSLQTELDSVRERHLLVARNLTSTMSRYSMTCKQSLAWHWKAMQSATRFRV